MKWRRDRYGDKSETSSVKGSVSSELSFDIERSSWCKASLRLDPHLNKENKLKNFSRFIGYFESSICPLNTRQIPPKKSKYFMKYGTMN